MILPANEVYISGIALKATTVTEDGEKLILTCIKPELWEVVSKIDFCRRRYSTYRRSCRHG